MFLIALLPGALAFATRERSLTDAGAQGQDTVGAAGPLPPK
jgi:hypothetical protein